MGVRKGRRFLQGVSRSSNLSEPPPPFGSEGGGCIPTETPEATLAQSKTRGAPTGAAAPSRSPQLLTLACQASDEVRQLCNALDAHLALDNFLVPEDEADRLEFFTRLAGFATLKRALNDELWRLMDALFRTTTRLYACAAEEAREP